MIAGSALLATNDAVVKWLTSDLPVGQIMFLRGGLLLAGLSLLLCIRGRVSVLRAHNWVGQFQRTALVVLSTYLFVNALKLIPLADAISIAFASPLFTTLLAVPLLRETVGWRRWSAVLVGFLGVLLIAQPTGAGLAWAALLPLSVAFLSALRDIVTRRLSATEATLGILFYTTAGVTLGGLLSLPFGWQPLDGGLLGLLLLSASLVGAAHFLQIEAFRYAAATTVAPYRYVALVWALLLGYLVWGSLPNALGWLGALLIIASGLFIWWRERVRKLVHGSLPPRERG